MKGILNKYSILREEINAAVFIENNVKLCFVSQIFEILHFLITFISYKSTKTLINKSHFIFQDIILAKAHLTRPDT